VRFWVLVLGIPISLIRESGEQNPGGWKHTRSRQDKKDPSVFLYFMSHEGGVMYWTSLWGNLIENER
jgi:hypothetical protein